MHGVIDPCSLVWVLLFPFAVNQAADATQDNQKEQRAHARPSSDKVVHGEWKKRVGSGIIARVESGRVEFGLGHWRDFDEPSCMCNTIIM